MLEHVTPAVVNISVRSHIPERMNPLLQDPFFRQFFGMPEGMPKRLPPREVVSAGSGVIVDADRGYVLTNHHVIDGAEEIRVTLHDERQVIARRIGSDPETDIAVLLVDADGLSALPFADSDRLRVGDFVVAVGNPFGLGQTVTSGIVSALGRRGLMPSGYEDFIQTDASINPGNSGGALVDSLGRLIGINSAIIASSGGNVGIGFAIPSNIAREVMQQLIERGVVQRGQIGVLVQSVTPELAKSVSAPPGAGALVSQVESGSPAERAGLQRGDVIIELDGVALHSSADLRNRIGMKKVGSVATLLVLRDGRRLRLEVKVDARRS
jgi:Do/DeqQ family serine protease